MGNEEFFKFIDSKIKEGYKSIGIFTNDKYAPTDEQVIELRKRGYEVGTEDNPDDNYDVWAIHFNPPKLRTSKKTIKLELTIEYKRWDASKFNEKKLKDYLLRGVDISYMGYRVIEVKDIQ